MGLCFNLQENIKSHAVSVANSTQGGWLTNTTEFSSKQYTWGQDSGNISSMDDSQNTVTEI